MWPRGTVGGVLGAERGSCRRTPRGRSEEKAGGAPSSAAWPGRWEGRTSVTRAQGQGEGTRPGLGAPRPRRGEDPDRRSGAELGSGPRTSSPRRTPPRSVHGAALAATLPQRGPGGGRAHRRPSSAVGRKTWRSGLRGRRGVRGQSRALAALRRSGLCRAPPGRPSPGAGE